MKMKSAFAFAIVAILTISCRDIEDVPFEDFRMIEFRHSPSFGALTRIIIHRNERGEISITGVQDSQINEDGKRERLAMGTGEIGEDLIHRILEIFNDPRTRSEFLNASDLGTDGTGWTLEIRKGQYEVSITAISPTDTSSPIEKEIMEIGEILMSLVGIEPGSEAV